MLSLTNQVLARLLVSSETPEIEITIGVTFEPSTLQLRSEKSNSSVTLKELRLRALSRKVETIFMIRVDEKCHRIP